MLLAAVVVSMTSAGFVGKVLISTLIGLVSFLYVHVPEWIWFGYPQDYVVAQLIMTLVGWALTGVALAVIIKPKEKPA